MMSQPEKSTPPITQEERSLLRNRAAGTVIVGVAMVVVLLGFGGFAVTMITGFMSVIAIVFLLFFLGILVFIFSTRLKNAGAIEKTVYTGVIREKRARTTGMRGSSHETYEIQLDDLWFHVEGHIYDKVHTGEKTALHTIGGMQVFKVERLKTADKADSLKQHVHQQHTERISRNSYSGSSSIESIGNEERSILRKAFRVAFIFRTLICGFAAYVLFHIVLLIVMFSLPAENFGMIVNIYYIDLIAVIAGWILLNRRSINILRDLQSGGKTVIEERVLDKIGSNTRKPGPRSIIVTGNYTPTDSRYFYIQTKSYWLSVSEDDFNNFQGGDVIRITLSKHSKIILNIS